MSTFVHTVSPLLSQEIRINLSKTNPSRLASPKETGLMQGISGNWKDLVFKAVNHGQLWC